MPRPAIINQIDYPNACIHAIYNEMTATATFGARSLDWNLLRTFLAIGEARSISRAAKVLNRSQPAVSTALKRLEAQLGTRLVLRSPTAFALTEAGALLHRECREVFSTIDHIPSLLQQDPSTLTGTLSLTLASHIVSELVDESLARMAALYPALTIDISLVTSAALVEGVRNRSVTLGICLASRLQPELTYFHLYKEYFAFFCGPRHPHFGRQNLRIADLAGERAVSFKAFIQSDVMQSIYDMHRRLNLALPFAGLTDHLEELRRMIVAGVGIGALPLHIARRDVEDRVLWPLLPDKDAAPIDVYLVTNPKTQLSRAESAFAAVLKDVTQARSLADRTYPRPL
jgi:DNA-binding transcriptional LysR family regulator